MFQISRRAWGADLGGAGAIEGVSLQDVSSSFQELIVDASNDVGAGDDQQVIIALQLIRMALVAIPSEVLLAQPVQQTLQPVQMASKNHLYKQAYKQTLLVDSCLQQLRLLL